MKITLITCGEYSGYNVVYATTATREEINAALAAAVKADVGLYELTEFLKERLPFAPWTEAFVGGYHTASEASFTENAE